MIYGDFSNLVWGMSRTAGTPYLSPSSDPQAWTDLLQESLHVYTSITQCLIGLNIAFTPSIGVQVYDTFTIPTTPGNTTIPSSMTAAFCDVRHVTLNGAPLQVLSEDSDPGDLSPVGSGNASMSVQYGESDLEVVLRQFPGYLTAPNSLPVCFWQELPNKIWFNCPFDAAYSSNFISGRLYHSPLLSSLGGLNQVLDLPPEDIRAAARYTVARLIEGNDFELGTKMLAVAEAQMLKRWAQCNVKSGGNPKRGSGSFRRSVDLAR